MSTDLAELSKNAVSTADLLIYREQEIARQKYRIGIICSGILEKPEDKMKNFSALFELMSERTGDQTNLVTVRKIAALSLLEVFKDILPEYRIGQLNLKMQTGWYIQLERPDHFLNFKFCSSAEEYHGTHNVREQSAGPVQKIFAEIGENVNAADKTAKCQSPVQPGKHQIGRDGGHLFV